MVGVNNGFCLGFDKWLGYDVAIMEVRTLGFFISVSWGLAFTLSWEARSNQIAGLRAIVQSDCRTACNHAIVLYHGFSLIVGLRAIAQSDCSTACNHAVLLVSWVWLRWD